MHAEFQPCNESDSVRLTHGDDTSGRLEVCYAGNWGSVCNEEATNEIATVVCQQMGHTSLGIIITDLHLLKL